MSGAQKRTYRNCSGVDCLADCPSEDSTLPLIISAQQWKVAHIGVTVQSCRRHAQYRLLDASFDSNLLRKWSGFVDRLDKMLMKPIRPEESGTLLRCTRS
jgi:hypothetical protein